MSFILTKDVFYQTIVFLKSLSAQSQIWFQRRKTQRNIFTFPRLRKTSELETFWRIQRSKSVLRFSFWSVLHWNQAPPHFPFAWIWPTAGSSGPLARQQNICALSARQGHVTSLPPVLSAALPPVRWGWHQSLERRDEKTKEVVCLGWGVSGGGTCSASRNTAFFQSGML